MSTESVDKDASALIDGFLDVIQEVNPLYNAIPTALARMLVAHFVELGMLEEDLTPQRLNRDLYAINMYMGSIAGQAIDKFGEGGSDAGSI